MMGKIDITDFSGNQSFSDPDMAISKDGFYQLGIGLGSQCNFNCIHCYYHDGQPENRIMPLSLLKTVLSNLPRMANIIIGLEGEPFCHPQIFQALDIMALKSDSIRVKGHKKIWQLTPC